MKIISAQVCMFALAISGAAAAGQYHEAPASIRVQCQNINWNKLTVEEKTFAADTVKRALSYVSSDRSQLKDIQIDTNHAMSSPDIGYFHAVLVKGDAGRHLQACWPCYDDSHNLDDDGRFLAEGSEAGYIVELWQNMLEHYFLEASYSAFSHAQDCQVDMDVGEDSTEHKSDEKEGAYQVDGNTAVATIAVQCHNMDWGKLTPSEKTFFAINLGRAFNTVANVEGTSTQISNVD